MRILVTGCCGFIGSHLCEKLLIRGDDVHGIDILNDYYDVRQKKRNLDLLCGYENFHFYKEDLVSTNLISELGPNVVVNLGAMAGIRYSIENPEIYMRTNIEGQTHLLKECVKNKVKLFVYASSSSVYGLNSKIPFSETDSIDLANSPYAVSKKAGEDIAKLYNRLYKLKVIGLRFFTVYGPRGRPDMAPYKFLNAISCGKSIDKYGNGESLRDYTYIDDIINGIIGAINNKNNRTCEIYNLGNNKPISLNTFISACEKITGKIALYIQKEEQLGDVPITYADINKASSDLDYNPSINIEYGLKKMYEWMICDCVCE